MMYEYIIETGKWRDKRAGAVYHACRITRIKDRAILHVEFSTGSERQSAIMAMSTKGWIDKRYKDQTHLFERENSYPIMWCKSWFGLQRDVKVLAGMPISKKIK